MKLKHSPDDFRVEELPNFDLSSISSASGKYSLYRLEKREWNTPDAIAVVRKRWHLHPHAVSFGGLKDRHAKTVQYFSVFEGPVKELNDQGLSVKHVGRVAQPYTSEQIRANAFEIVVREMTSADVAGVYQAIPELARIGVPNYFDDQRFGGVGSDGRFVAKEMVQGNFEEALKLALCGELESDRSTAKREKSIIRELWGDWKALAEKLPHGHAKGIVLGLVHIPDFAAACGRLWPDDQGLHLSAWQSHLWNRMLDRWIGNHSEDSVRVSLKTASVRLPLRFSDEALQAWDALQLPYPSARLKLNPEAPWADCVSAIMKEEQIPLEQMKIPGMRKPFFSKGERTAKVTVNQIRATDEPDELHEGRRKTTLAFELPRGSYATMVFKRLTANTSAGPS